MRLAGGTIDAHTLGSGATLMLFHSLLADRSSYALVADALAQHFRVVMPSLPGFAESDVVSGDLADIADRMAEAVADATGGAPALLLGNGYGGFVALQLTLRHPALVSRLVLADAGARFSEPGREAFRAMSRAAAAGGLEAVAPAAMRRLFAADFLAAHPDIVAERRERFLALDRDVFIAACHALANLDLLSQLPTLEVPLLVVVGELDEATPVAMSRELVGHVPHARLQVLPGCAHVAQLQAPDQFLAAVLPFLREDTPAR